MTLLLWAGVAAGVLLAGAIAAFAIVLCAIAAGNDDLRAQRIAEARAQAPGAGHARPPIAGEPATAARLRPAPGTFNWERHEQELRNP